MRLVGLTKPPYGASCTCGIQLELGSKTGHDNVMIIGASTSWGPLKENLHTRPAPLLSHRAGHVASRALPLHDHSAPD